MHRVLCTIATPSSLPPSFIGFNSNTMLNVEVLKVDIFVLFLIRAKTFRLSPL